MNFLLKMLILLVLSGGVVTSAFAADGQTNEEVQSAFRMFQERTFSDLLVPTVVEIPLQEYFARDRFAVFSVKNNTFIPYAYQQSVEQSAVRFKASSLPKNDTEALITDGDAQSFAEYGVAADGAAQEVEIHLTADSAVTSTMLSMLLDQYTTLPRTIQVSILENASEKVVLASQPVSQELVHFPKTTAKEWIVRLTYMQPIRINELTLVPEYETTRVSHRIRFLAQPNETYIVYADADRNVAPSTGEVGNLSENKGVRKFSVQSFLPNTSYKPSDFDKDGVIDVNDNCIRRYNKDQLDIDNNNQGDACDDFDKDGIQNAEDNCQNTPNRNQLDADNDGAGDVCDSQENRLTEKYSWAPWVGIIIVFVIITGLFVSTLRQKK